MSAISGEGETVDFGFVPASRASLLNLQVAEAHEEGVHFGRSGGNEQNCKCATREVAIENNS